MPSIDQIKANKAQSISDEQTRKRLAEIEQSIVRSSNAIIKFLDGKVTKTQIVNQLDSIKTPDVQNVVEVLEQIKAEIKPTDLSDVISELKALDDTNKRILAKAQIDNTKQLETLVNSSQAIKQAIDDKELSVNVDAPVVNIDAPDLKPIITSNKDIIKAIQNIKISNDTDTSKIESNQKDILEILDKIYKKPVAVGGGGGFPERLTRSNAVAVVNPDGTNIGGGSGSTTVDNFPTEYPLPANQVATLTPLAPQTDGLTDAELRANPLATITPAYKLLLDDTSTTNVTYVGKAAIGSATSASVWQIQKIDETTGMSITWAGTALFTAKWDDRTTETYA